MEARPWKGAVPAAMDLARAARFTLGPVSIEPALRRASAGGRTETLEPRAMRVLVALAGAAGGVLTRDDLLELAWDGQIVSDNAINRVISQLRRLLADLAGDAVKLETITKVGFRLIAGNGPGAHSLAEPSLAAQDEAGLSRRGLLAGGAIVLLGAAGLATWRMLNPPADPRVLDLLERGRAALRDEMPDSTQQGIGFFTEAVRLDPEYAPAWGLLALAYRNVAEFADEAEIAPAVAAGERAARRALALDDDQAEALAALALLPPIYGDWLACEKRLRAVLERHPDQIEALAGLGLLLFSVGRAREAAEVTSRLVQLDPLSPIHLYRRAYHLWTLGHLAEADQAIDRGMQLWPTHPAIRFARFLLFAGSGRHDAALQFLDDHPGMLSDLGTTAWRSALTAARSGSLSDAARAVAASMATARTGDGCVTAILALSQVPAIAQTFVVAEGYLLRRGPLITNIGRLGGTVVNNQRWRKTMMLFTPATQRMRADPRFAQLCEDIGLERYWRDSGWQPTFREQAQR
jgi:DNA-binding winged helix-turn-helix (wHTH) protein